MAAPSREPVSPVPAPKRSSALRWLAVGAVLLTVIIVPFVLFETEMNALSDRLVSRDVPPLLAGSAIAALLAADVVLPVPSSVVSTAGGALLGFAWGTFASWLGMTIGCAGAWLLGKSAGRAGLARWVGANELARAEGLAERYGVSAVILARPVPVLAEATALLAGAVKIPFPRFIAVSALANLGISIAYAAVGAWAADVSSFLLAFVGAIGVPGLAMLIARARRR